MKSKFNKKLLFFSLIILFTTTCVLGENNFNTPENSDDILMEEPIEMEVDYSNVNIDSLEETYQTRGGGDPTELLLQVLKIAEKIQTPLWRSSKPPKGRDTLYLLPQRLTAIERGGFVTNLFFNYTDRMNFSPDEALKLEENKAAIEEIIKLLSEELSPQEASSLIPLFRKMTIQERKAGGLIQAGFYTGPFIFQLNTSIQISERNFWLNQEDQDQIKNMFTDSGSTFDSKELYKINYGLGDTRLKAGLNTINTSSFQMDVGFEGIIPSSEISSDARLKEYDIDLNNFVNSLPDVLKSIRDNLITPQLGNNGHFGLGCYMETKLDLFHDLIHLWNRISFDNLFIANEIRLIPSKQTMPSPADDPTYFQDNIVQPLIGGNPGPATEFVKEYIFPPPYKVSVDPGGVFNFVANLSFDLSKKWIWGLGYDFYMQQKERFTQLLKAGVDASSLRIEDAIQQSATQHKLFTEIDYIKKQHRWDLILGLGGDYTIANRKIGQDWTLFVKAGASF